MINNAEVTAIVSDNDGTLYIGGNFSLISSDRTAMYREGDWRINEKELSAKVLSLSITETCPYCNTRHAENNGICQRCGGGINDMVM